MTSGDLEVNWLVAKAVGRNSMVITSGARRQHDALLLAHVRVSNECERLSVFTTFESHTTYLLRTLRVSWFEFSARLRVPRETEFTEFEAVSAIQKAALIFARGACWRN